MMNKPVFLIIIMLFLVACEKDDDERNSFNQEIPNFFKYKSFAPILQMDSYDTLKHFSCGPTPFPLNYSKSYTMDVNGNFNADFSIKIEHTQIRGSGCPQYLYVATISGVEPNTLIATEGEYAIKFDSDSIIRSNEWQKTAYIHRNSTDPNLNHTFSSKKFIGFSVNVNGTRHYGYFQVEFPQSELYISSYAVNYLNSDFILAGQKE